MDNKKAALALGTEPVGKLLLQYAMPAIIAMTAASLYNIVDSVFIGQGVGPLAISGLALTFPVMNLSAAFGAAVGVGACSFISMKLGQRDYDTAQNILGNTVTLNVITGIAFGVFMLLFLDDILYFFGASENTLPYARDYLVVILLGNVLTHLYFGMNGVLRAAGKPRTAMYLTIFTVLVNAVLDPLFIYTFQMGIRGAAVATIISQTLALVWQMRIFGQKEEMLHFHRGTFRLRAPLVRNILSIGISPFAMNACACLVVVFINTGFVRYGGDLAVGAYGISNRIVFVVIMVVVGICQGMQPIVGYNYGAKKIDRMLRALNLAMLAATSVSTLGFIIAEMFPYACVRMFTNDEELIRLAAEGTRLNVLLFPLVGAQIVITNFFQSIGKAGVSIFLSLSRQMLFLIPCVVVLPLFWGYKGVWYSLPMSDAVASVTTFLMMWLYMKRFKEMHKHNSLENER